MKISEHFTLSELTKSSIALRHGIDNKPGEKEIVALRLLAAEILEPVRNNFGVAFSPSSGFRCPAVNHLAGSGSTSQHVFGQAADFELPHVPNHILASWIFHNCDFDQLILEYYDPDIPNAGWVHASVIKAGNRRQFLSFDGKNYKRLS